MQDLGTKSSRFIPTRTHPYTEIILPTRTTNSVDEFRKLNSDDLEIITRSTYSIPKRTMTPPEINIINEVEEEIETTTKQKKVVDNNRRDDQLEKVAEKDSDSSYNLMFYNDEDGSDVNSKKEDQDISDNYFDKKGNLEDSSEKVSSDRKEVEMEYIDPKKSAFFNKDLHIYSEEYGSDNCTVKISSASIIGIPAVEVVTTKGLKDTLRDKRRPFCNLLKLRPLSFNSPRTLPEVNILF